MKKYNSRTYSSNKNNIASARARIKKDNLTKLSRDEVITLYLPLVENIARKFKTSKQASGIMSLNDIIQEGYIGLIMSYDLTTFSLCSGIRMSLLFLSIALRIAPSIRFEKKDLIVRSGSGLSFILSHFILS